MNTFPIKELNLDAWKKKVDSTSMFTIQAEDDALPILKELEEILSRLIGQPIQETIDESHIEFFFTNVFPPVCQKIIRSRYFKSTEVLRVSNSILKKCIFLTSIHFEIGVKFPKFLEVLTIVFSDEHYFKTNNQMSYTIYVHSLLIQPYSYFPQRTSQLNINTGDMVDVLKVGSLHEKFTWSQGQVIGIEGEELEIAYLYDGLDKKLNVKKDSNQLAPYGSQSLTFEWRKGLKNGDLVDIEDHSGSWYNATIVEIIERENGKKNVRVTLKVYHENGNKSDENGQFFGFSDYEEIIDFTSPKLAPFCTIAKQFCYEVSKSTIYDTIEDINDYEFQQLNGNKIYALPRKKHLSEFQFETINGFGKLGGFDKYMEFLEREVNFDVFCYFVKGISGVAPYLNRKIVKESIEKFKILLENYLFQNPEKSKNYSKQQSEMAFSGLKVLQKRVSSSENISKYENQLKMRLVDSCLQSEAIKNKLQGLNELKDIVRSVVYASEKNKYIKKWVKDSNIFEKVYITNSHVQLIKKSEEFFKYLITENILEVIDLERLYKLAQKGDFESRVSLYKLFQEVSHIFKKEHVEFLIDTILESDLNLILNEDIDLLHELSKFSNYFPLDKVIKFFENIILGENRVKELNDYAIKKYSEIVAKNHEVKPFRRKIIKTFLEKLSTHDTSQIAKVLKGIFDGIGTGEWGKKDLNEIIVDEKVDEVVVATLQDLKNKNDFHKNYLIILEFLLFIYKLSSRIKIDIKVLSSIWSLIKGDTEKQKEFYKWANEIMKCDQSFDCENNDELEIFYRELFPLEEIPNIEGTQMEVAKNFFVEINKKAKFISVSNTFKDREIEKEYKRKVEMKSLKLIELLTEMVYQVKEETANHQIFNFYIELYTSKDNSQQEINEFLFKLLKDFKEQFQVKNTSMLVHTIKLMEVVINDSEKNVETNIKSLLSKKEPDYAKFIVINETSYLTSESAKKLDAVFAMNTPVIKLRKHFAKLFNISWQEIKIVSNKEIEDYENSLTLSEIKLNPNQPLTISRRSTQSQTEEELILNDEMNPKLVRCFKVIFEKYSTNGKMDKNQANSFTAVCLGSSCSAKYYNEKIANLYNNFDDDNDGYLTLENFLKFYGEACRDRPPTVWTNLRNFGVMGNFRFSDEPEERIEATKYPRNIIADEEKVYEILFDLLHSKDVASVAFELLERLPVSKVIEEQLLNIESGEDLLSILNTPDLYELFYKLNIIEYLAHSTELETEKEKQWHSKFVSFSGYESLYATLLEVMNKIQPENSENEEIIQQIFQTSLNLLIEYWIECFSSKGDQLRLSLSFISYDEEIDEKMDYLVFNKFFKSDKKIMSKNSKIQTKNEEYFWKGENEQSIGDFLLKEFTKRWVSTPTISHSAKKNEKIYGLTKLLGKLIDSLDILFLNKDPHKLIDKISNILDQTPSSDLIKQFYCLILSQCFHANENKYQGFFIRELFKNLTKGSITSEHFRVLSTLVYKYGIGSTNDDEESEETTKKLKQVLLDNVFNHTNELTVEGCAKLLTKFKLEDTSFEIVEKIWDHRLFNPSTICEKEQSKVALYDLILKICNNNPEIVNKTIHKVLSTLNKEIKTMKIVYCNEYKQRSNTGFAGLKNLGSTCYINSMLQQLFMNKNFRYSILRANDNVEPAMISVIGNKDEVREVDDNFLHQVQRIFSYLELTNRIDFVPKDFCVAYKPFGESVNVVIQQDVQEFVSMFFDRLEAGLSKTVFKKLVEDFYSGKTANLFKCHACQKTKKVEENFHSISLEVKTSKTLAESFNRFCLEEMINDYKCDFCGKKVDVTKVTRISKTPKTLIIHLQRIVFNYDTFINEKITTKHSFPQNFNIYESTLENYERAEAGKSEAMEIPKEFEYNLIGIICHTGTADSGHYISYIKTNDNKWIEFNDSQVTAFNPANMESECFGGNYASSSFDDDFYEEKRESSKSAYLLLYEKHGENTIELVLDNELKNCKTEKEVEAFKQLTLQTLNLKEVITKIKTETDNQEQSKTSDNTDSATPNVIESHEESSSAPDDSEKETKELLDQKEIEIRRHLSEDNIETDIQPEEKCEQPVEPAKENIQNLTIVIEDPISPYIPEGFAKEIQIDNEIHFFEKCLSSSSFVKFFSQLISKPNDLHEQVLSLCQKLTFGFWLKSPSFKDLLNMLDGILKVYPAGFESIVTNNPAIENLLIESSDSDIRTVMANFLAKVIADTIESKNINISNHPNHPIFNFLDKLLSLLPTTVSKYWTKFGQYFEFWYELSNKGEPLIEYMIDREIIKHFMDYFLDNKSPLKIYAVKRQHTIGSSYANPNFSMLLKCVFSLLQHRFNLLNKANGEEHKAFSINSDEELLLMSFESLEKLISDNYESIAAQLVKQICPNNISASEKTAIVLLRGINKSSTDTIQPYLEVLHQFILIEDQYQDLRIKWVIGRETLALSTQSKLLTAINGFSLDERIHNFNSALDIENGSSLLEPILVYYKRIETFSLLLTRELLRLCDCSKKIRKYIFTLSSPTLTTSRYVDFLKGFIDKYYEEQKRSYSLYSSSSQSLNKEELGKEVKELHEKIITMVENEQKEEQAIQETEKQQEILISESNKNDPNETENGEKTHENITQTEEAPVSKEENDDTYKKDEQVNNETDEEEKDQDLLSVAMNTNIKRNELSEEIYTNNSYPNDHTSINQEPVLSQKQKNSQNEAQKKLFNQYSSGQKDKHQISEEEEEEDEPYIKSKELAPKNKVKEVWHPIKFEFTPIKTLEIPENITGLSIEEHKSPVTYILTTPTGTSNQTFLFTSGVQRISDRIQTEALKNSKIEYVHGFFARNTSRDYIRIQTNDGSVYCKQGDCLFIWADSIEKIWLSERSIDWPKWQLFSNKTSSDSEE